MEIMVGKPDLYKEIKKVISFTLETSEKKLVLVLTIKYRQVIHNL